jgi:hypothetical protein
MHGLENERGSEFLCERKREEWREAALISSAPRFSSSLTGLLFFSSNYISSKFRWEFKNLSFPFVKAITWDEICRRRESIDAYSPIDALGMENRLPFRSRSSTIGVHQPLIRRARSRRQQRSGTFNAKCACFQTFKTNLGDQTQLKLVQLLGRNKRLRLAHRVKFWMGSRGGSGPGGGGGFPWPPNIELGIRPGFRLETWFFLQFCDINKIGNFFAKLVEFTL